MSKAPTATCAKCDAPIAEDAKKCEECGNFPAVKLRNNGIAVIFAGGFATIFHVWTGLAIAFVGLILVVFGVSGQYTGGIPASEHDLSAKS